MWIRVDIIHCTLKELQHAEGRPDHSSEIKISLRERGQVCLYRLPTASRREEDLFPCRLSVDIDTCGLVISLYSGRLSFCWHNNLWSGNNSGQWETICWHSNLWSGNISGQWETICWHSYLSSNIILYPEEDFFVDKVACGYLLTSLRFEPLRPPF